MILLAASVVALASVAVAVSLVPALGAGTVVVQLDPTASGPVGLEAVTLDAARLTDVRVRLNNRSSTYVEDVALDVYVADPRSRDQEHVTVALKSGIGPNESLDEQLFLPSLADVWMAYPNGAVVTIAVATVPADRARASDAAQPAVRALLELIGPIAPWRQSGGVRLANAQATFRTQASLDVGTCTVTPCGAGYCESDSCAITR